LIVGVIIGTTLEQRYDVIALRGKRDAPCTPTLSAERITHEQIGPHLLQTATGDTLRRILALNPGWTRMIGATP